MMVQVSKEGMVLLAFADHSNLPVNPGALLRNVLLLAAARWRTRELQVL
jgi:hypothetical protein